MGTLTGFPAATRLGKVGDLRLTAHGLDRVRPSPATNLIVNAESIGQVAAGDITKLTINQHIIDPALTELDKRDVDSETRTGPCPDQPREGPRDGGARGRRRHRRGCLALDVLTHAVRLIGLGP